MSFSDYCFRMLVHQNREHISKVLRNSPWQNNVNSESSSLPWRTHTQPSFPRQQQMQIHWQTYYFCAAQSICTHHFHIYASHSACVNDLMETSATDTRRLQHKGLRQLRTPTHVFFNSTDGLRKTWIFLCWFMGSRAWKIYLWHIYKHRQCQHILSPSSQISRNRPHNLYEEPPT